MAYRRRKSSGRSFSRRRASGRSGGARRMRRSYSGRGSARAGGRTVHTVRIEVAQPAAGNYSGAANVSPVIDPATGKMTGFQVPASPGKARF